MGFRFRLPQELTVADRAAVLQKKAHATRRRGETFVQHDQEKKRKQEDEKKERKPRIYYPASFDSEIAPTISLEIPDFFFV